MVGKVAPKPPEGGCFSKKNFSKFFFIFLFPLWGLGGFCYAQTPPNTFVFKQFSDGNGTLSNIVSCFLEDKDGFLWVGTADGLKRFDGHDFTIFKHDKNKPNSLIHNEIEALCEDNFGRIWVGTGEGISYFDKKTNQFFNFKEFNKNNNICFNILSDNDNNIWFSIRGKGLYCYSEKTKKIQNFTSASNNKNTISSVRIYSKGMILDPFKRGIWLQTVKGINFFEFSTKQFYNKKNNPKKLLIFQSEDNSGLGLDGNNLIFFDIIAQKIIYFDIEKNKISKEIKTNEQLNKENIEIKYIFVDKQHNLWLSDWFRFCYYLDFKTNKLTKLINEPSNPNSIVANSFWCTYQQKDGTIWLGTNNGIVYTNPQKNFYQIHSLADLYEPLKVRSSLYYFKEDTADSTWWLAADEQNFLHYFPKTNRLETFNLTKKPKFSDQYIHTFVENQHVIYVVSTCSFHVFDKKLKTVKELFLPDSLSHKNIISHAKQQGDSIWFFCNNSKAYSYKISTKKWKTYPILTNLITHQTTSFPFLTNNQASIYCSEVDNDGNIWIAIQNVGLAKFSKQKQAFELIKVSNEVDFKTVNFTSIRKDATGNLWIGAYDLIKFNPKTYEFQSALDVNVINDLIIDKEGKIWTAAYNDFMVFYPKTQKTITTTIPINKGNLQWRNYLYLLENGKIVSLMRGDVAIIDPAKLISTSTKDKVLISRIALANDEIVVHNDSLEVNLEASKNGFGIFFSTLNPPDEHKYQYNYQLSGYQNEWITTLNSVASFSNLDGGDYVFKVKGTDDNGYETPISSLNIHIETVFYKSMWFLYFCIFSTLALVYAFMKFRSNQRTKIHFLQVQSSRLEKDKTEIQYQNLINHLNPHFLFNSLTSLKSLIKTKPKEAANFLQKLSLIYRYILQNKDKEVVSLEQEIAFVRNYIDLQKSRFDEGLQINIDIKEEYLLASIVPVTLQNLFENAIKHNTLEEDKPLIINVLIENNFLIVKNNLQKKVFVETSNKQGLDSLKSLYKYLTTKPLEAIETKSEFLVKVPLL